MDKVIGAAMLADELPIAGRALLTSSRASFELVQKAVMAGVGMLIAVSAPSSLAVQLAAETGLTLIGFTSAQGLQPLLPADDGSPDPEPETASAARRTAVFDSDNGRVSRGIPRGSCGYDPRAQPLFLPRASAGVNMRSRFTITAALALGAATILAVAACGSSVSGSAQANTEPPPR